MLRGDLTCHRVASPVATARYAARRASENNHETRATRPSITRRPDTGRSAQAAVHCLLSQLLKSGNYGAELWRDCSPARSGVPDRDLTAHCNGSLAPSPLVARGALRIHCRGELRSTQLRSPARSASRASYVVPGSALFLLIFTVTPFSQSSPPALRWGAVVATARTGHSHVLRLALESARPVALLAPELIKPWYSSDVCGRAVQFFASIRAGDPPDGDARLHGELIRYDRDRGSVATTWMLGHLRWTYFVALVTSSPCISMRCSRSLSECVAATRQIHRHLCARSDRRDDRPACLPALHPLAGRALAGRSLARYLQPRDDPLWPDHESRWHAGALEPAAASGVGRHSSQRPDSRGRHDSDPRRVRYGRCGYVRPTYSTGACPWRSGPTFGMQSFCHGWIHRSAAVARCTVLPRVVFVLVHRCGRRLDLACRTTTPGDEPGSDRRSGLARSEEPLDDDGTRRP